MPRPSKSHVRGLYKEPDKDGQKGRYRIDLRYTGRNGEACRYKERLPEGTSGAAAKDRAAFILNASVTGTLVKRGAEVPVTLGEAFDKYLEWCKVNGKGDPAYKTRHRAHWIETLGEKFELASLGELAIERHKKRRRDAGKAPGTVNRELVTIKHFLGRCEDWGWIDRRPKVALLKEPAPRVRWLSDGERSAIANALAQPQRVGIRRLVSAALLSGIRLSNLVTLQRNQVDIPNRNIGLPETKSGKRLDVPISDALRVVLEDAMAASTSDFVFVAGRKRGGKQAPYTRSGVSGFFRRVAAQAGLRDFHFHDLRHTFATEVRRAGHGLDVVQALLGHSSPTMTQRYAHLGQDDLKRAVEGVVGVAPTLPPTVSRETRKPRKKGHSAQRSRAS